MSQRNPLPIQALLPGIALDVVGVGMLIAGVLMERPWLVWSGVGCAVVASGLMFLAIRNHMQQGDR